jgi:hypothetical protein
MISRRTWMPLVTVAVLLPAAALAASLPLAVRRQPVDLELVIMTDTSGSIDQAEARLQRQGIAAAFRSEEVVRAIQSGVVGRIAVAYVDWAGFYYNTTVVDWTIIRDKETAEAFAARLMSTPLNYLQGTAVGGALYYAAEMIETNALDGSRRTIDISGDGPNNQGPSPYIVKSEVAELGITINGLPIITYEYGNGDWGEYYGDIFNYYRNCVIGGRNAFVIPAEGFEDFARAVRRKLVLEISDASPFMDETPRVIPAAAAPAPRTPPRELPPPASAPARAGDVPRENCISGYFDF